MATSFKVFLIYAQNSAEPLKDPVGLAGVASPTRLFDGEI
jgi:hypothetical protein